MGNAIAKKIADCDFGYSYGYFGGGRDFFLCEQCSRRK